jgi:hypothetical protein
VAEAVRRIVVDWAAEVTTEEPAEETTELVDGIGTELLVEMMAEETAELVDAIGEELLAGAVAEELEAVYQSSAIGVSSACLPHETKNLHLRP